MVHLLKNAKRFAVEGDRGTQSLFTKITVLRKINLPNLPRSCMLEFFKATISFNLPPVRLCGCKDVCKCDFDTCLHNWWTTRGDSGRLASSTGWSARGDTLFQKILTLLHYLYWDVLFQKLLIFNSFLYLYWGTLFQKVLILITCIGGPLSLFFLTVHTVPVVSPSPHSFSP